MGGDLTKKIAESTQLKNKDVKGVFAALRTIAYAEVKKTEKFVIPQLTTLKLKQARAEGGHEGDVREGGEGGGETRLEGGEGLPREGAQGLDLSHPRQQDSVGITRSWSCHGVASNTVHGRQK